MVELMKVKVKMSLFKPAPHNEDAPQTGSTAVRFLILFYGLTRSRDSSVGIAISYGLDD
jgi:hypothetical protein